MSNTLLQDPTYMENLDCNKWGISHSATIEITEYPVTITYQNVTKPSADQNWHTPSSVLFYSDDAVAWPGDEENAQNHYKVYSTTRSDAYGWKTAASGYQYESIHSPEWKNWGEWLDQNKQGTTCSVTAVRYGRYVLIRMENAGMIVHATTTIPEDAPDSLYLVLTGEVCTMTDFVIRREPEAIGPGYIEPVVETKTFIPTEEGDIPNIDCSGWWLQHSDGILVTSEPVHVTYHSISYPQAKESWHAPLIVLFSSMDQLVNGVAYTEYSITRNDGYGWITDGGGYASRDSHTDEFITWLDWLGKNKEGVECKLTAYRKDDMVIIEQENSGVKVISHTIIPYSNTLPVFISLSGELCAITNIRISRS